MNPSNTVYSNNNAQLYSHRYDFNNLKNCYLLYAITSYMDQRKISITAHTN